MQQVKPKVNGSRLFAIDVSKQKKGRVFSPPNEGTYSAKKPETNLLHNEIEKYQTKMGKKIKDLDGYNTKT